MKLFKVWYKERFDFTLVIASDMSVAEYVAKRNEPMCTIEAITLIYVNHLVLYDRDDVS